MDSLWQNNLTFYCFTLDFRHSRLINKHVIGVKINTISTFNQKKWTVFPQLRSELSEPEHDVD